MGSWADMYLLDSKLRVLPIYRNGHENLQPLKISPSTLPVLIAGGGIGGLVLGRALRRSKIPFVCLEQSPTYRAIGGGIGLWGPALKALRQIGIEDSLKGKHLVCAGYRSSGQISQNEWLVRPDSMIKDRHTSCLCIRRAELQLALVESMREYELRLNSKVVSFSQSPDSVLVTLQNGEVLQGSLLVAADGVNSIIASSLFPNIHKRPSGYNYWQGVAPFHFNSTTASDTFPQLTQHQYRCEPEQTEAPAYEAWHPGIRFGVVPLSNNECFWFICSDPSRCNIVTPEGNTFSSSKDPSSHQLLCHQHNQLVNFVTPFGDAARSLVHSTAPHDIYSADLVETPPMDTWSVGRVTCLGDAVHAMAPNLAQGACLAIEDAVELAHQLHSAHDWQSQASLSIVDLTSALQGYENKRRSRVRLVQTLVPLVHTVGACNEPYSSLRNLFFGLFPSIVKTTVFDLTHRIVLGWSYTPPNLGQGLYHRILDGAFMSANPSLSRFHADDVNRICSGDVTVERGNNGWSRLLATVLGLPPETASTGRGEVKVRIDTSKDGSETWKRVFSYYGMHTTTPNSPQPYAEFKFTTRQAVHGERLVEYFGPFEFSFDVEVSAPNTFKLLLADMYVGLPSTVFVVPIPYFLRPCVTGWTIQSEQDTGWTFDVQIRGPSWADNFIGLIVRYTGEIDRYGRAS